MAKRTRATTLLLAALLAAGLAGCDGADPGGPVLGVEIRVRNGSQATMSDVTVSFPFEGGDTEYGDLAPGQVSGYEYVEQAYRYAAVRVVVEGDTLRLVPIDYVGETPLPPGRYTYRLGLFEAGSLTLELE